MYHCLFFPPYCKLEMSCVIETHRDHGHPRMNEEPRVFTLVMGISLGWMSSCPSHVHLQTSHLLSALWGWYEWSIDRLLSCGLCFQLGSAVCYLLGLWLIKPLRHRYMWRISVNREIRFILFCSKGQKWDQWLGVGGRKIHSLLKRHF